MYVFVHQPAICWLSSALEWTGGWWVVREYRHQNKTKQMSGPWQETERRVVEKGRRKETRGILSVAAGAERWMCELNHWHVAASLGAQTPIRTARRSSQQNSGANLIHCRSRRHSAEKEWSLETTDRLRWTGKWAWDAAANVTAQISVPLPITLRGILPHIASRLTLSMKSSLSAHPSLTSVTPDWLCCMAMKAITMTAKGKKAKMFIWTDGQLDEWPKSWLC